MNYYIFPGLPETKVSETVEEKIELLIFRVAKKFNTNREELESRSRLSNVVEARGIIFYIVHKVYGITQEKTGLIFSRNHATVRHAAEKIGGFIQFNKSYETEIKIIINSIH